VHRGFERKMMGKVYHASIDLFKQQRWYLSNTISKLKKGTAKM
jgi:hypothetical protein